MKSIVNLFICVCVAFNGYTQEAISIDEKDTKVCPANCCRPDGEGPAGIMTDHVHFKGQWMISYAYMNMLMNGNRIGTAKAGDETIFQNYAMAPDKMSMQMHMAMLMYGITDKLTAMGMFSYVQNNMTMHMNQEGINMMMNMPGMGGMSVSSTMTSMSSGFADSKLYALYSLKDNSSERIVGGLGLSIPTGSIMEKGMTLLSINDRLAYPMQIGTGSFSLLPSITYVKTGNVWVFGAAVSADVKLNDNSEGYRWGNVYNATAWVSYRFLPYLSGSVRAEGISAGKISGNDNDISQLRNNDPNANTNNFGGQRANVYAGLNFYNSKWSLQNLHFLAEYGMPVYENLNGPQMSLHSNLILGVQYMFN